MNQNIKPIETRYKGYRFRSRLEARWAVFLDSFNEQWEYEKEGYELSCGRYLPDFWLPRMNCWLEIKSECPTAKQQNKIERLADATNKPALLAWGIPQSANVEYTIVHDVVSFEQWRHPPNSRLRVPDSGPALLEIISADGVMAYFGDIGDSSAGCCMHEGLFWALDKHDRLCICTNNHIYRELTTPGLDEKWMNIKTLDDTITVIPEYHVNEAKSARFEYGD